MEVIMAINTTDSRASKGLSKNEAVELFKMIQKHQKTFSVIGGKFEESSLENLPNKGKVNFWIKLIEESNGISIPIARHILSRMGFNPKGKDVASINKAFEEAMSKVK